MPFFHHFVAESFADRCCSSSVVANQCRPSRNGIIKQVRSGYLLHYKKRLFGKPWREVFVVLYEDSSIIWFRDRDRLDPEGGIFLKEAPEMLAAGQWVSRVPVRPDFPSDCDPRLAIAMGSRSRQKIHWFLCKSEAELIDWMTCINHTLPPPPPPPEALRASRRNLASKENRRGILPLSHQFGSLSLREDRNGSFASGARSRSASRLIDEAPTRPVVKQRSFHERGTGLSDVATGALLGLAICHWNPGLDCWDWGMGWGWNSWNTATCDTCALEQAALAGHVPIMMDVRHEANIDPFVAIANNGNNASNNNHFSLDDDHDLGELGEADVGCDFDFAF